MKKLATVFFLTFLCGTVYAQANQLQVVYESPEGMQLARFNSLEIHVTASYSSLLDANGDGVKDLIMTTEDDRGDLKDLLVVAVNEARPREVLWRIDDVPATLGLKGPDLVGFANVFGGNVRHGIFTDAQGVHLYDPADNSLAWSSGDFNGDSHTLIGVLEVTGDGFDDLLILTGISMPTLQRIQVWSIDQ